MFFVLIILIVDRPSSYRSQFMYSNCRHFLFLSLISLLSLVIFSYFVCFLLLLTLISRISNCFFFFLSPIMISWYRYIYLNISYIDCNIDFLLLLLCLIFGLLNKNFHFSMFQYRHNNRLFFYDDVLWVKLWYIYVYFYQQLS